ncbi:MULTISPECIES: HAD family hydrolase [Actinomadura]|uniref:Sugar-phosphatase n=1 Tax=Actinomadura madurae TaxID=1993 RepID=A0A1I5CD54_9ACTN|nr:HAD family phosphatase [Actinomadura madurae]MCP9950504.1 HAD family phosphatase [Actinomadura madurae]URM96049.1 HAD family phosphatase [Actinomadura madurae]URN06751.1 HAD family phosphatase [Actinomadura madurae]SFN84857.1 sugar-phosphatase [Actinomadura madurae]SPT50743.1 Phosphatase YfbT [Actinomadura madurae]
MAVIGLGAAVFDLDGTLIDTEPRNRVMWSRLFEAHGVPHDEALIASFAGRRGQEVLEDLAHLFPGRTVEELFAQALSYESVPGMPAAAPVPGAVDLVRSLADAGVPLAVVTSGQRPYAEGLLAELGIRDLLDIVVTAGDVVTGKPHPEGYLAAARDLDVPPQETIGFEDAPAGVAAVKAAGMTCVGVITTQPAGALADADHVVADFKEVDVVPGPALRVRRPVAGL